MRVNRYLARCGLGSRRAVEQLILEGKVAVNGALARDLTLRVNPASDRVTVEGREVHPPRQLVYLMLNKPRGYDVTRGGRHHHRRAWDLLPEGTHEAVQSVGRLDRNSTGLLLFTNDGDLAFRLTHPRFGCAKVYRVELERAPDAATRKRLLEGIELEDGPAKALNVNVLEPSPEGRPRLELTMSEGRKHIVRRLCEAAGHPVLALHRTRFGPLELGPLRLGKTRALTRRETIHLRRSAGLE